MRAVMTRCVCTAVAILGIGTTLAFAQETKDWKAMERDAKRAKVDQMADEALATLFKESATAKELYDKAYGYAVFDNLKVALGVSGGGGNGVAVVGATGERTYMKMGTVGIGFGLGGKSYQVVFLYQDEETFSNFVNKGWQADASAGAVAGTAGAGGQTGFINGVAIYVLTDKGLMANADIAGTKYWKNKKLNE